MNLVSLEGLLEEKVGPSLVAGVERGREVMVTSPGEQWRKAVRRGKGVDVGQHPPRS